MKPIPPADAVFLMLETRNSPMHVAGLYIFTPPPGAGPNFIADFYDAWKAHTKARVPFNQRPVLRGRWFWEEDREFELDYHLRRLALPQPARIRELLSIVSQLHGTLMDRNRPLWEMTIIEGLPGGRFAIYAKIHHALIDGITGAKMLAQSLATRPDEQRAPLWAFEFPKRRKPVSPTSPTLQERVMGGVVDMLQAGREILPGLASGIWDVLRPGNADTGEIVPLQAPPTPFNVPISSSRRFAAQSYSLPRLQALGQAAGATVNDIALAICAGALRKYLQTHATVPSKPLIAMVPVSLHDESTSGNQVSLLLANLGTHIADPVKRLAAIVQSTTVAKERLRKMKRLEKMAHGMSLLAPTVPMLLTGAAKMRPIFNVVISNVPGPRNELYLGEARLAEVYPVSIPMDYTALNITISGYGDTLGFGYTACRRSVPSLQRMLDYTAEAIAELEEELLAKPANGAVRGAAQTKLRQQAKATKSSGAKLARARKL